MTTETETVFSATTEKQVTQENTPTTPLLPQEVAELVGQGKKYATVEDALKSVPHAQSHIKTLEEELAAVKVELEKRRTAEQLLDEIKSGIKSTETPSASPITPDTVAQLVEQALKKNQSDNISAKNVESVTSNFSNKFGDKAEEVYINLAKDNGLTVQQLNTLSKTSPALVLKLAGFNETKQQGVGSIVPTVNTESFSKPVDSSALTSRVRQGASTKELVSAWKVAGQKVANKS